MFGKGRLRSFPIFLGVKRVTEIKEKQQKLCDKTLAEFTEAFHEAVWKAETVAELKANVIGLHVAAIESILGESCKCAKSIVLNELASVPVGKKCKSHKNDLEVDMQLLDDIFFSLPTVTENTGYVLLRLDAIYDQNGERVEDQLTGRGSLDRETTHAVLREALEVPTDDEEPKVAKALN